MKQVDIVYTFVDDKDENWQKKREIAAQKTGQEISKETNDPCRYKDNDELKYSLRSIEKYAPWINKIFIVTDNQTPKWLNTENERVKIVNHTEIIDTSKLPLFNSCAIEWGIANIKDLSEYFLYANDDMFFWNEVSEDFFFEGEKPVCRVGKKIKNKEYKHVYGYQVSSSNNYVKEKLGFNFGYFPHHNIDAYRKSLFIECIKEFKDKVNLTQSHTFRDRKDFQRIALSCYMSYKNQAVIKKTELNPFVKLIQTVLNKGMDSQYCNLKSNSLKKVLSSKAKLMCINDSRKTQNKDRDNLKTLLEKKFPKKSQFEI